MGNVPAVEESNLRIQLSGGFNVSSGSERWYAIHLSGMLAAREGKMHQAAMIISAHKARPPSITGVYAPRDLSEYDQALALARAALGEAAFSAAWEEGSQLTEEQALQLAWEILEG